MSRRVVVGAVLEDFFGWKVDAVREESANVLVEYKLQLRWDRIVFILVVHKALDGLDRDETVVLHGVTAPSVKYAGTDDGCQVLDVHSTSGLFVNVGERSNPFEEHEKHLHRISVAFRQKANQEMKTAMPFQLVRQFWQRNHHLERVVNLQGESMSLTLRSTPQPMKLERHQRIRHLAQEPLEECRQLYWVVFRQGDGRNVPVKSFHHMVQALDVAVLTEDPNDRHI
jgi:hypothetical protein